MTHPRLGAISHSAFVQLQQMPLRLQERVGVRAAETTIGQVGSWAVWAPTTDASDTSWSRDVSALSWDRIGKVIHADVIFLGLNKGVASIGDTTVPWSNFHTGKRDYMLAEALRPDDARQTTTGLWGGYMTDFFKGLPTPGADGLRHLLDSMTVDRRQQTIAAMVEIFCEELAIIGATDPLIICLGDDAYSQAREHLSDMRLAKVTHYSAPISRTHYRAEFESLTRAQIGI